MDLERKMLTGSQIFTREEDCFLFCKIGKSRLSQCAAGICPSKTCVCVRAHLVCLCARSFVFRCFPWSVRGEVASRVSPSVPSPVKLTTFATSWLPPISLHAIFREQPRESERERTDRGIKDKDRTTQKDRLERGGRGSDECFCVV